MGMDEFGHGWGTALWWLVITVAVIWGAWLLTWWAMRRPPRK